MNFNNLPRQLIDSILEKSNFETIAKLSQTCSTVNKIIKKKKLDKIDVGHISFMRKYEDELWLTIDNCYKFSEEKQMDGFAELYVMVGAENLEELEKSINGKIRQILNSIKSAEIIEFLGLLIDDSFVTMLKEMPIRWNEMSARFINCRYNIPKSNCLSLWKMFKSVDVVEGVFKDGDIEVINDEMIFQTLPSIVFTTDRFKRVEYQENPNITDRTLDFLADNRPASLIMGKFISNFTVDGIMQLLNKVVHSRDPSVDEWVIGAVRLHPLEFIRLLDELATLETDYSTVLGSSNSIKYEIAVVYMKENSDERATINLDIIKPEGMFVGNEEVAVEVEDNNNYNEF